MKDTTMNTLEDVKQFHELFNHPVLKTPTIPNADRCKLRLNLLKEEIKELEEAIEKNDIVEAADAFADIQYVLSGAILEFGLAEKFPAIFAEVQRSNMSKACENIIVADKTVDKYDAEGQPCHSERKDLFDNNNHYLDTVYLVFRNSDSKLLKSVNYSPANLEPIVKG